MSELKPQLSYQQSLVFKLTKKKSELKKNLQARLKEFGELKLELKKTGQLLEEKSEQSLGLTQKQEKLKCKIQISFIFNK